MDARKKILIFRTNHFHYAIIRLPRFMEGTAMITNDRGIRDLKHDIATEVCKLAWEGALTDENRRNIAAVYIRNAPLSVNASVLQAV